MIEDKKIRIEEIKDEIKALQENFYNRRISQIKIGGDEDGIS